MADTGYSVVDKVLCFLSSHFPRGGAVRFRWDRGLVNGKLYTVASAEGSEEVCKSKCRSFDVQVGQIACMNRQGYRGHSGYVSEKMIQFRPVLDEVYKSALERELADDGSGTENGHHFT
jgi:hypothetical protein